MLKQINTVFKYVKIKQYKTVSILSSGCHSFVGADPWGVKFIQNVKVPEGLTIPLQDPDAWKLYPKYQHVYNKLFVAHSQNLAAAPYGVIPTKFPVFLKPIINLQGMGVGTRFIPDMASYCIAAKPGHFWCEVLTGTHISSDAAIVDGKVVSWRHATAFPGPQGTFDYFRIEVGKMEKLESWCGAWVEDHMKGYTGMTNFETIGNKIIEAHLRLTDQWPDLYESDFLKAVVRLYDKKYWDSDDSGRKEGFSVILFGDNSVTYRLPSEEHVTAASSVEGVTSIQISFFEKELQGRIPTANPPGGKRLAIINSRTLEGGFKAREILRQGVTPETVHATSFNDGILIRPAARTDCKDIYRLIQENTTELFKDMPRGVQITADVLVRDGFDCVPPLYECLVADDASGAVGYMFYSTKYCTWEGKYLYLQDLFISRPFRKHRLATKFFRYMANIAVNQGYSRMTWELLDWNQPIISFCKGIKAVNFTKTAGFHVYQLDKDAIQALASYTVDYAYVTGTAFVTRQVRQSHSTLQYIDVNADTIHIAYKSKNWAHYLNMTFQSRFIFYTSPGHPVSVEKSPKYDDGMLASTDQMIMDYIRFLVFVSSDT